MKNFHVTQCKSVSLASVRIDSAMCFKIHNNFLKTCLRDVAWFSKPNSVIDLKGLASILGATHLVPSSGVSTCHEYFIRYDIVG